MDIAGLAIRNRTVTLVLTAAMLVGGFLSYQNMSRLEDPEFTIKEALVITPYAGATAQEVEEEVTDPLETSIQGMGQLKQVRSKSERGLSTITVEMKEKYDKSTLPQVWDELRRKVNDAQNQLPPGSGSSIVIDDYGDVYGVFVVITGDGYSYAELKDYVDLMRRELLLVQDVGKITTFGERREVVYVEFNRDQLSQLGISVNTIVGELTEKNTVVDAGRVRLGQDYVALDPTGAYDSVEKIERLLILGAGDRQFYLRDVARVRRGYEEPYDPVIRYDGRDGIALGISTVSGGNVVTMGEALRDRVEQLESERPIGIEVGQVSVQSLAVVNAIDNFVVSLVEAVAIVVVVLLLFMGLRSGLIIGFVLVLTIAGSFLFLDPMGVALERISLGALIIALGMLVDNAIVVVDGMLVRIQRGMAPEKAASDIVKQSLGPLLGATLIAVLAFASIGTSSDSTGEFCRSLFQVVLVSLLLSWVTAITVTPLLGVMFLKGASSDEEGDPYEGGVYGAYRRFLEGCLKRRLLSMLVVLGCFGTALWGFGYVDQSFFPSSTRPQFMVDVWLPQGTHIDETRDRVAAVEEVVRGEAGVSHVSSMIGEGALRFLLTYNPEQANSGYAQLLVDVAEDAELDDVFKRVSTALVRNFPGEQLSPYRFEVGPGGKAKIEARFVGPDANTLRSLAEQASAIIAADPDSRAVRTNWRQRVSVLKPVIAEEPANLNGISRAMIADALRQAYDGVTVGVYRERDLLLPIILRAEAQDRASVNNLDSLQIWSPVAGENIPLRQVVSGFELVFEDEIIHRRDRKRSISVFADPTNDYATDLFGRVRPEIEAIPLPPGYELEWGGEYEDTANAQGSLAGSIPAFVAVMVLITVALFNSLRVPLIIWLCVPMAIIGVTTGLLASGLSFGFMSLLGFLSLMGMLIKNAIVLMDEINLELASGKPLHDAIVSSGTSRLRPVAMAALTTALGMIPLLFDAFFASMAITIIGGLVFATVLTMIVVPVLYASFFRASEFEGRGESAAAT